MNFYGEALSIKDNLVYWRREFHMHPELGYEEVNTSSIIKKFLRENGIEYYETAKTGICAFIKGNGSKTIGIRADIDALPIEDKKTSSYASKIQGMMHACGHDAHASILMGTAFILNKYKENLKGNVKLFFEPAEETTGGAKVMIKESVLENPYVDGIIGLHVDENILSGKIGIKKGVVNAASNPFIIKIKGKGAHGARPQDSVDPIFIGSSVILNLQSIISRELPPTQPAVITIGTFHGGTAQNIIPEEVEITGIIRTMTVEHRKYVIKRFKEIVEGMVKSLRGQCIIEVEESYPCLYNDEGMYDSFLNSASKVINRDDIIHLSNPSMGVESFAYFAMERPAVFYYLGVRNEEKGIIHAAHSNLFDIDEDSMVLGVALHCQAAQDFLDNR